MLTVNPERRPDITKILAHPWLRDSTMIAKANTLMGVEQNNNGLTRDDNIENIPSVTTELSSSASTSRRHVVDGFVEPPAKRPRRV